MPLWTDLPPAGPVSPTDTLVINQGGTFAQVQASALGGGGGSLPPGVVQSYAGATVPVGWLDCDGSAVSRTTFAALFAAIGTTWGGGDGITTFNLPDLRGRSALGVGAGSLSPRVLGDVGGEENHFLNVGELALHNHGIGDGGHAHTFNAGGTTLVDNTVGMVNVSTPSGGVTDPHTTDISISDNGGGGGHNTMHPFAALFFIIKT